jgi:hypothetical protein
VVTFVNGSSPERLTDFLRAPVVSFAVESHGQVVQIRGSAHLHRDVVLVHEKDSDGTGKDVRTWQIQVVGDCFEAVERSTF